MTRRLCSVILLVTLAGCAGQIDVTEPPASNSSNSSNSVRVESAPPDHPYYVSGGNSGTTTNTSNNGGTQTQPASGCCRFGALSCQNNSAMICDVDPNNTSCGTWYSCNEPGEVCGSNPCQQ